MDYLAFDLFEAGMLQEGLGKQTPGDATIVLKPMQIRKATFAQALIEIGLFVGQNVALPLFVSWLYDECKRQDEKPITVVIYNHYYQFDPDLLIKAIQEAIGKESAGSNS